MRNLLMLAPAALAACSTAPAPADTPVHGVTPGHKGDSAGTGQFIGADNLQLVNRFQYLRVCLLKSLFESH